jgi:hypothetical protein
VIDSVEQYLVKLKEELKGSDRATIQDALSDAEEYLRTATDNLISEGEQRQALEEAIGNYGAPEEVAAAYKQVERRSSPMLAQVVMPGPESTPSVKQNPKGTQPALVRFLGVYSQPLTWGSLLYCFLALVTGIIYFTWVVTGISVSACLLVLIVGLPIAGVFLLSVRGIALVEGRLVEALLGVRMPRRPRYSQKNASIWRRFKKMLADRHTWFSMIYMLLQLPLGFFYFSVLVTLVSTSIGVVVWPIVAMVLRQPVFVTSTYEYFATGWLIGLCIPVGVLLLTATMHLARVFGRAQGGLARALLVSPLN